MLEHKPSTKAIGAVGAIPLLACSAHNPPRRALSIHHRSPPVPVTGIVQSVPVSCAGQPPLPNQTKVRAVPAAARRNCQQSSPSRPNCKCRITDRGGLPAADRKMAQCGELQTRSAMTCCCSLLLCFTCLFSVNLSYRLHNFTNAMERAKTTSPRFIMRPNTV